MDDCRHLPVFELLKKVPEERVRDKHAVFTCPRDPDGERFLRHTAITFKKKGLGRTYAAVSDSDIVGHFALGIECMRISDDTPFSVRTKMKTDIDRATGMAQSYLLGQLGRSDRSSKSPGARLLEDAIDIVRQANGLAVCRVLGADCADGLLDCYRSHGFVPVARSASSDG